MRDHPVAHQLFEPSLSKTLTRKYNEVPRKLLNFIMAKENNFFNNKREALLSEANELIRSVLFLPSRPSKLHQEPIMATQLPQL